MINESDARHIILKKRFPWILGGMLCALAVVSILIVFAANADSKYLLTIFGTELLLYMLLNASACLIVAHIWKHVQRTLPVYALNFVVVAGLLYLLLGKEIADHHNFYPVIGALVFSFFASIVLITLIRTLANFFKEE